MIETLRKFGLTTAQLAIAHSALCAEARASFWKDNNKPGAELASAHEAQRLWRAAVGDDGWLLDRRMP